MDKADLWPDLGASNVPRSKIKMERAHSFAGALKKQTKVIDSGSATNLVTEVENSPPVSTNIVPNITETETKTHQYSKEEYEEWKQTQKLKRQAKKQEKRLLREEELRRQMVAPKGYRVQLVTESVATKSPSPPPQLESNFGEFPELGSPIRTLQPKVVESQDHKGVIPSTQHASPSRKPSTKRKDPIIIDLQQMIVPRTKKQVPKRHEVKSKVKKAEEILSGNPLDSSQPVRHRGKSELSAVISLLPGLQEAYQNATSATPVLQAVTNVVAKDVNKQVVSSLLTKLEQSLQPAKSAAFLQAIEAAEVTLKLQTVARQKLKSCLRKKTLRLK
ncbi:hypothetical protein B566_EDAN010084 [Ephemera danica]|nr:hypothetical protein B566_EDAN010084 [Ephemera danica]